ncbi:MAG: hypothetical protein ACE364_02380 [Chlorobiota bacterium]
MKLAIYIILILFTSSGTRSQEIVVSEYFNDNDVENEWTELIVTEDFLDLEGYTLRDNNDNYNRGGFWQGGISFNQNKLWKNLRIGTIIVVNHRDKGITDVNLDDGYIEVNALDSRYFTKYDWRNNSSLSIDNQADIVQILDKSGQNVHSLGHVQYSTEGDFHEIIGYKIAYVGNCPKGYSISVGNASRLSEYSLSSGYDTGKSITMRESGGTKGVANSNPVGADINYQFWQKIREPLFFQPNLETTIDDSTVVLNWEEIDIDNDTNDFSGYIILRTTDVVNNICKPKDGTMYNVGDKVCSTSDVIAILEGKEHSQFIDVNPICGQYSRYSIFAYNYTDEISNNWDVESGRGIAYSSKLDYYNSKQLVLNKPDSVHIKSRLGNVFCSTDTTILYNNYKSYQKGKYKYAWIFQKDENSPEVVVVDFSEYGLSDSIKVYRTGYYTLIVKSEDGCEIESNTLKLEVLDIPEAFISDKNDNKIVNDTTIYICEDEELYFQGSKDLRLKVHLYRGKFRINNSGFKYKVTEPGEYYYIYSNGNCRDTSNIVTVKESNYDLVTDKEKLKYQLITNQTEETKTIQLTNNSSESYNIYQADIEVRPPFKIKNSFPITIDSEASLELEIEFKPIINGLYIDTLLIHGECNNNIKIALNGVKSNTSATLVSSLDSVDFKEHVVCEYGGVDTTITLTNIGTEFIVLNEIYGGGDFFANPIISNDTLAPGETFEFVLSTNTNNSDVETVNLFKIPWTSEFGQEDTTYIAARIHVGRPRFEVIEDTLDFGIVYGCEDFKIDTIHIENTGRFDVEITGEKLIKGLELLNSPLVITPGDTSEAIIRYSSNSPIKINQENRFAVVPGCMLEDNFFVIAERASSGYIYEVENKSIDFGKVYSCNDLNIEKDVLLKLIDNPEGADVRIEASLDNDSFIINDYDASLVSETSINLRLNESEPGEYVATLELTINPCDRKEYIEVKVEIIDQSISIENFTFADYEVGFSSENTFELLNNGEDVVSVSNIQLPAFVKFKTTPVYPILLSPNTPVNIDVIHESMIIGGYSDSIEIETESPCNKLYYSKFNGLVNPSKVPPGEIYTSFGIDRGIIAPKNTFKLPIQLSSAIHELEDVNFESVSIELNYPFEAFVINDITIAQQGLKISYADNFGKLMLEMESNAGDRFSITKNEIIEIEFYALDAVPGEYIFKLESGNVNSFPLMSIETDDTTEVELLENCINDDKFVFLEPVKLNVNVNNNLILIDYFQPTNDIYNLNLYDINGEIVKTFLHNNRNNGQYEFIVDSDELSSGSYLIMLEYSDKLLSRIINITK